jgi:FkbM family methyltransferase
VDVLGYFINMVVELYRSKTKNTVYTTDDVINCRSAELRFKLFGGRRIGDLNLVYDKISDVIGLYDEIFCNKCYDFIIDKPDPYIIDAGANIGLATLRFLKLYPGAHITAFEPQPEVFKRLQRNVLNNHYSGNVRLVNAALSDTEGEVSFNRLVGGVTDCCASLMDAPGMNDKITVHTETLIPYIDRRIDVLKLDIEGSEYDVLKNVSDADLLKLVDRIIIEYHPVRKSEVKNGYLVPLVDLLNANGYFIDVRLPHEMAGEYNLYSWMDGFSVFMIYASRDADDIGRMGCYAHYDKVLLKI